MKIRFIKAGTRDEVLSVASGAAVRVEKGDVVCGPQGQTWDVACVKMVLCPEDDLESLVSLDVWVRERKLCK